MPIVSCVLSPCILKQPLIRFTSELTSVSRHHSWTNNDRVRIRQGSVRVVSCFDRPGEKPVRYGVISTRRCDRCWLESQSHRVTKSERPAGRCTFLRYLYTKGSKRKIVLVCKRLEERSVVSLSLLDRAASELEKCFQKPRRSKPITVNAMVDNRPSLFRKSVGLDASLNHIDSVCGCGQAFDGGILE